MSKLLKRSKKEFLDLVSFVEDRKGHDFRYAIDFSKIKKELVWKPKHSLEEGIEKTVFWYLENYFIQAPPKEIL